MKDALFIGGEWVMAQERQQLEVVDPATEEVFHHVASADAADVQLAVLAAGRAWQEGWPQMPGRERAGYLRAIGQRIHERAEELARLETRDNGKPLPEAKWDIDDTAGCFTYYAELAEQLDEAGPENIPLPDARFSSTVVREALGVCGQIIPWNYPMLMAAWKVAPALAAGCTMVLKPSEYTPITALELAGIAAEVGLPAGVLNVVTGTGKRAGEPLAHHPRVEKLAFTGSVPTGSAVMRAAAQDIKNVSLELGGKSPVIVFEDADLDLAVEWILFGIFWNQGQVCSATSRLLVHESIADRLLAQLVQATQRICIGNGLDPGVKLGPLVSRAQFERVTGFIERGRRAGHDLLCGGSRPQDLQRGYFVTPAIFADVPADSELWREEVFGPVLCTRRFTSEAQAVAAANDSSFGLAAAVLSRDEVRTERVARALRAGIVWINCSQPTFTQAPWGGMKKSGIGRELGRWGLESYLAIKQITRYTSAEPWGWYS
jgi:betaine-aldehyde dehydrogenase